MTKTTVKKSFFTLVMIFFVTTFISCNKEVDLIKPDELTNDQLIQKISQNIHFKMYANVLSELVKSPALNDNLISEAEFAKLFELAVAHSDQSANKQVARYMGFANAEVFWKMRSSMNENLLALMQSYDLRRLSKGEFNELFQQAASANTPLVKTNFMSEIGYEEYSPASCLEELNACNSDARASFAIEQVACVAFGSLGWTGVGVALFVACEAASNNHLATSKRRCSSGYSNCK